jgi:hypothetical protein
MGVGWKTARAKAKTENTWYRRTKMTKRLAFTKSALESLPLPVHGRDVWHDTKTPGLVLLAYPSGRKAFYLYRRIHGLPEYLHIGAFPAVTVEAHLEPTPKAHSLMFTSALSPP